MEQPQFTTRALAKALIFVGIWAVFCFLCVRNYHSPILDPQPTRLSAQVSTQLVDFHVARGSDKAVAVGN